jgi:hypothetical protein
VKSKLLFIIVLPSFLIFHFSPRAELISNTRCEAFFITPCIAQAGAEPRVYRQIKDIATEANGDVSQSDNKANLFEYTFEIDKEKQIIIRTKVQRLDWPAAKNDATVYNIREKQELIGDEHNPGDKVYIAMRNDGEEILELGHRFAFTMRTSQFSQVITGVYKRVYPGHYFRDPQQPHHHQLKSKTD